ncbi:MAG: hypothetical protein A2Y15_06795 [Clostridiales bacterium GWF2_36_10]|nr:MAG: hypothetical protein A2Y15_06795 [Clostridiales bacterium GWF2_36_10]HAN20355.1 hypothetical protein [Clostridiales bacterium]
MIYKNSYFVKELRQAYIENRISIKRKLILGIIVAFISIFIHFITLSLKESVFSDIFPHLMQNSYFSALYSYIAIFCFLNIVYFVVKYEYITFSEIRNNRWYLLVKMGYNPQNLIYKKIAAMLLTLIFMYTTGFSIIIITIFFLKYTFVYNYLSALYLIGLLDLTVTCIIGATISLFSTRLNLTRLIFIVVSAFLYVLKILTGYSEVISNPELLLFNGTLTAFDVSNSWYYVIVGFIVLSCLIICFCRAKEIAKYYSFANDNINNLPIGTKLARLDERTKRFFLINKKNINYKKVKIIDISIIFILIAIFIVSVLSNIFAIIISTSKSDKMFTVNDVIPYIITDTVSNVVDENDIAFFKKSDASMSIENGNLILYENNDEINVGHIKSTDMNSVTVDVNTIEKSSVIGVCYKRNRWFGVLILFTTTVAGRFLFIFIPAMILFLYKPLKKIMSRIIRSV